MASYNYSLSGALLEVTCSDSKQEHVDERRLPNVRSRPDGQKRMHRQQFNDSAVSKEWRKKIAVALATKFLLKPENIDYLLAKFPKGYFLYSDEIGDNHVLKRYDAYLYSDDHKFRSPAEFIPHAAWLIYGMPPGRCKCKYCSQGRGRFSQSKLNKELEDGYNKAVIKEGKKKYQALKNGSHYTPRDLPLEEVFLKPVPIPEAA